MVQVLSYHSKLTNFRQIAVHVNIERSHMGHLFPILCSCCHMDLLPVPCQSLRKPYILFDLVLRDIPLFSNITQHTCTQRYTDIDRQTHIPYYIATKSSF